MKKSKVGSLVVQRMVHLAVALGLSAPTIELFLLMAAPQAVARSPVSLKLRQSPQAVARSPVSLKLRHSGDRVDLIVTGVGEDTRVIGKQLSPNRWQGRLQVDSILSLSAPQEATLLSAGLRSVRLIQNNASELQLVVMTSSRTVLTRPKISANGQDLIVSFVGMPGLEQALTTAQLDLRRPGRVAQPVYAPPLQSRAVAPPLGDMAVGTMVLKNHNYMNLSGPSVSLTLNNAAAKDALMALARLGGYGFVFLGQKDSKSNGNTVRGDREMSERLVSLAFKEENYAKAFNSVLLAAGLQGRLDGRIMYVGSNLANASFSPSISKVYRLNQVSADSAAQYLASLGARVCVPTTTTFNSSNSATEGTASASSTQTQSSSSTKTEISCYGGSQGQDKAGSRVLEGPLLGVEGTTDSRLSTVTLLGEPRLISVAEGYLKNLDLRKRQVAVKVQIMSVDLLNDKSIDASFSSRIGNTFILSDSGKAVINFGTEPGVDPSAPISADQANGAFVQQQRVVSPFVEKLDDVQTFINDAGEVVVLETPFIDPVTKQRVYVPDNNPNAADQLVPVYDELGRPVYVPNSNPALGQTNGFNYPSNSLDGYLEAAIDSSSAKTLASPTLLVQEGEEAQVKTGTSVITGVSSTETANGSTQFENTRENAGLTLNLKVRKIDDNGFVTMDVNPSVSIPQPAGTQSGVPIFNITARSLSSGSIRLRDRQTLVLTGVIQDSDREIVRKWPILGDMPFIGQLFRSSASQREKQELVILVTPSIVDDNEGGSYGYGYRPSTKEARQLLGPS